MSFYSSWGYASVDEVSSAQHDQPNHSSTESCDTFLISFKYDERVMMSLVDNSPNLFRIANDYEDKSAFLASRFMLRKGPNSLFLYPSYDRAEIVTIPGDFDKVLESCSEATNLKFAKVSQKSGNRRSFDFENLLLFQFMNSLLEGGYTISTIGGQSHNSACRQQGKVIEVVSLRGCSYGIHQGQGQLLIDIQFHRINSVDYASSELSGFMENQDKVGEKNGQGCYRGTSSKEGVCLQHPTPIEVTFLPSNEPCMLHSFRRIHESSPASDFLTAYEQLNRKHGYVQYAPSNYAQFKQYWELAYGITLPDAVPHKYEAIVAHISNRHLQHCIVPLQVLVTGIVPLPVQRSGRGCTGTAEQAYDVMRRFFEINTSPLQLKFTSIQSTVEASAANREAIISAEQSMEMPSALKRCSDRFTTGRVVKQLNKATTTSDKEEATAANYTARIKPTNKRKEKPMTAQTKSKSIANIVPELEITTDAPCERLQNDDFWDMLSNDGPPLDAKNVK